MTNRSIRWSTHYHGYTARQRQFLRRVDVSMRLFEVDLDGMGIDRESILNGANADRFHGRDASVRQ